MAKKKKKGKKKVPARTILKRLRNKADKALSEYVRASAIKEFAGKCPFCKIDPTVPVLNKKGKLIKNRWVCFHFVRRMRAAVRWCIDNVIGACGFCNLRERGNPDPYRAFYIRKFGVDKYLALVDKSEEEFVATPEYLQSIVDKYATKSV